MAKEQIDEKSCKKSKREGIKIAKKRITQAAIFYARTDQAYYYRKYKRM